MEPHPQFSIDTTLPACRVTKALLSDLESNVAATLSDIVRDGGDVTSSIQLSIKDGSGEETLTSAQVISGTLFSDSTSEIQLSIAARTQGATERPISIATVRLRFRKKSRATLLIILQCARARDQAVALKDRILRVLSDSIDDVRFFRPPKSLRELLIGAAALGTLFWTLFLWEAVSERKYDQLQTDTFLFWSILIAFFWIYPIVCERYFPYCAFATKRRVELDEQRSWAKKAVWTLIVSNLVVGTVGAALAQKLASWMP